MLKRTLLFFAYVLLLITVTRCVSTKTAATGDPSGRTPGAEREFRAAWVATVANVNWPSKPGLPVEQQKKEAIELLDLLFNNNFNAVIFQVRPQCDAMYQSDLEPWSYYLTGKQGKAPDPYYDPLEFWIKEAHTRGIELHAWLNPYRAHHVSGGEVSDASIVKKRTELVVKLEQGYWWMEPTKQATQDQTYNVVMDLVRRYDLDGIHFDDYFYPYPSYNNDKDFPDEESWQAYQKSGGKLSRGDWRRESVNILVERIYKGIKAEKPYVKFGLSPFGIWRPYNPPSISGFDQHNVLYADARKWLNKGWVDYYSPQLYWQINQIPQSYPLLLGWWKDENKKGRHLWPGISLSIQPVSKLIDETLNQIMVARGMLPESPGVVHWSIGPLQYSPGLAKAISDGPYKKKALVPSSPWLDKKRPVAPEINISPDKDILRVSWVNKDKDAIGRWVVYFKHGSQWNYDIFGNSITSDSVPAFVVNQSLLNRVDPGTITKPEDVLLPLDSIAVSAVDRFGNESALTYRKMSGFSFSDAPALTEILAKFGADKIKPVLPKPFVTPGIDLLVTDHLDLIRGKKVGLITNPSAVGSDLRSSIDILAATPGVNLVALFGAEHGVRGALQGRIIQDGEPDPVTGIPVYSMYGDSFAPKKEWIENLDALIFDIQGVGSAWYTFKYSMSFAMQACAEAGIPFIVLDRPNPLGGRVVEGPLLDTVSIFRHPLPLRHGMTYGELATMWNETEGYGADLTVIKMKGWRRSMLWNETGLLWVMPSPNMGTLETAIVYPGQCLFERTNISEGRGTTKPFLISGSTWIDAEKAAADLNSRGIKGAIFRPVHFIPENSATGSNPRGKPWNMMSHGVEVMVTDPAVFMSVEAAVHTFDAYRKTSPDSLIWSPPAVIKRMDEPGVNAEEIIKACQDQVSEFLKVRQKYLLYR
ncbi:MAG: hypothetical protein A2X04_07205 [Bacteroidetes bacterium GWF2_41_9]|nr:MAG: hypothetical protein A2X03_10315 [Bacteroidetes bacterium GWA2_40_15]OFY57496.1 MAG: hypothetical protein A2X04_07205 [Bacteroidetes bacterium GWF2_41_9]HAM10044.1 hypothetical protein [Bacteroidales bacterium]HCU18014.1 hypothetical protein [Bacteroidales bacterium]